MGPLLPFPIVCVEPKEKDPLCRQSPVVGGGVCRTSPLLGTRRRGGRLCECGRRDDTSRFELKTVFRLSTVIFKATNSLCSC